MTVSAVCCSRFGSGSMVISPITQCFIKLCVETALQELRYRFLEQSLDIFHPSNIRVAQQLSDQLSSCLFLRCSFSAHFFFLHSFAFIIHCLWSLHKIWGGLGKGFSWRFQAINNLLISAQFVGYDVGYRAVIALISVSFFTVYAANVPCLCLMPCLRLFVNFWQTPF